MWHLGTAPLEQLLSGLDTCSKLSAAALLTALDTESEEVLEETFLHLADLEVQLDLSDLPSYSADAQIAARLRRKLLMRIERVADEIPDGAVTEIKSQDDGKVLLFKLRDLTAAYKDMAGDILKGEDADVEDLSPLEELLGE